MVLVLVTKKMRHKKVTKIPLMLGGLALALVMIALSLVWTRYVLGGV